VSNSYPLSVGMMKLLLRSNVIYPQTHNPTSMGDPRENTCKEEHIVGTYRCKIIISLVKSAVHASHQS